ncbi:MAG: PilZ domain-containing protein [Acidobacteriota bacterium]
MNKLTFTYETPSSMPRQSYRARVPGLVGRDIASQTVYHVRDISAGGVSLEDPAGALKIGDVLEMDVLIRDRVIIADLRAEVARHVGTTAGLKFTGLTRHQEERLDKLVLEVQKHLISKSKHGGSHIDDEQTT